MKKILECVKCGSSDIVGPKRFYSGVILFTFWHTGYVESYFCMDCGHIELVVSENSLKTARKLREKNKL